MREEIAHHPVEARLVVGAHPLEDALGGRPAARLQRRKPRLQLLPLFHQSGNVGEGLVSILGHAISSATNGEHLSPHIS